MPGEVKAMRIATKVRMTMYSIVVIPSCHCLKHSLAFVGFHFIGISIAKTEIERRTSST